MTHYFLGLQDRIKLSLQLGESHFHEFKTALEGATGAKRPRDFKAICKDIAETLVAFANADGGELLVGVDDDGQVSGVHAKEDLVAGLLGAPTTHVHKDTPLPIPHAARVDFDGKLILYFSIPKSTRFIYLTAY